MVDMATGVTDIWRAQEFRTGFRRNGLSLRVDPGHGRLADGEVPDHFFGDGRGVFAQTGGDGFEG